MSRCGDAHSAGDCARRWSRRSLAPTLRDVVLELGGFEIGCPELYLKMRSRKDGPLEMRIAKKGSFKMRVPEVGFFKMRLFCARAFCGREHG